MTETIPAFPASKRLNQAVGDGRIYTVLGVLLIVGLAATVLLGFFQVSGLGLLDGATAFTMGGVAILVISVIMAVLTFTLTRTIKLVRHEVEDLHRLRENVEHSYDKLRESAGRLGREVQALRLTLGRIRSRLESQRSS